MNYFWSIVILAAAELAFLALGVLLYWILHRFEPIRKVMLTYHILLLLLTVLLYVGLVQDFPEVQPPSEKFVKVLQGLLIVFGVLMTLRLSDSIILGHVIGTGLGVHISVIARHLIVVIVLAIVIIMVLSWFGVEVTPLLATSAIGTAIIGLALQDVLGNVIAGVALQAERPFAVGDWVLIGDIEGCVVEMNWRATKVKTLDTDHVIIPNSTVARERIRNFYAPTRPEARHLKVGVEYGAAPGKVKEVFLEAALGAEGVLSDPPPMVWLIDYGDFAITYEIKFWLDRYANYNEIQDRVMTRIWYLLKRHNITIPFPIRNVFYDPGAQKFIKETLTPGSEEVTALLRDVPLLHSLNDEQIGTLSQRLRVGFYTADEVLVKQNDPGDSFMIIASGEVSVRLDGTEMAQLGDRAHFGEMSLLTGEPRSATVVALRDTRVLIIDRECFETVLRANPAIAESLSKDLERINAENLAKLQARGQADRDAKPHTAGSILTRLRKFFRLD